MSDPGVELYNLNVTLDGVFRPRSGEYVRLGFAERDEGVTRGEDVVIAVIDTGVLAAHPDIAPRLIEAVDFTQTSPEDTIGHGTYVTLISLYGAPDARIVSVKAVSTPPGSRDDLVRAMEWVAGRVDVTDVNMSLGCLTPRCRGDCELCEAARRLVASGKNVWVAVGNLPGATSCPAKANDAVFAIGALGPDGKVASYSGESPDGIYWPGGPFPERWAP